MLLVDPRMMFENFGTFSLNFSFVSCQSFEMTKQFRKGLLFQVRNTREVFVEKAANFRNKRKSISSTSLKIVFDQYI